MSETTIIEEQKKPEKETPSNAAAVTKSEGNKIGMIMLVIILAAGITITALFVLLGGSKKDRGNFKADSGVEEIEMYTKDQMGVVLESIDFEKFDKKDPLAIINFDEIVEKTEDLSKGLTYTKVNSIDLAGKTVQSAVKMNLDMGGQSEASIKVDLDLYQSYAEDYKGEALSLKESFAVLQDADKLQEYFQSMYVKGNIEVNNKAENQNFKSDIELTVIDGEAYVKLDNLEISPETEKSTDFIDQAEGNTIKVELDQLFERIAEMYSTSLNGQSLGSIDQLDQLLSAEGFQDSDQYKQLNAELKSNLTFANDQVIETIQNIGNPVLKVIIDQVDTTEFFVNKKDIDPIRNNTNSKCTTADFSFDNTLNAVQVSAIEIIDILKGEEMFSGSIKEMEQTQEELPQEIDRLKQEIEDSNLAFSLRLCNDKDNKSLSGMGLDLTMETQFDSMDVTVDILDVDSDSDFDIEKPSKVDKDYTNEFNNLLEKSNLNPTINNSYNDSFYNDDSYNDIPSTRLNDSEDTYEDELLEKYLSGEMTYEEYLEELSRI